MSIQAIEAEFKEKVSAKLRLESEGLNRYRVFTPFILDDGDHLAIVMKREKDQWVLSDEGNTYMHLTYSMDEKDFQKGTRQQIIGNALSAFSVLDREGELILPVPESRYGDALYSFVQAILKISDATYLNRELVRSTFMEDFRAYLTENVPENRREFDWRDPERDPDGNYVVDCRINHLARPLLIFGLPGDDRVRDATITIQKFESWKSPFRAIGIFEDQQEVSRKVLARFSDVCEKQFSSLNANTDRIRSYFQELLS